MRRNRWIMGSAIGLAAIAVAIDHTRHRLPEPAPSASVTAPATRADTGSDNPCGLDASPCGLGENPCGLTSNPCSL